MSLELHQSYDAKKYESEILKKWEEKEYGTPEKCLEKGFIQESSPVFSIVLPPPNVTGNLHIGHAQMLTIEDIMVRYKRMKGFRTVWIPGTDHASIATQSRVEKDLAKEGVRKNDLGREKFLEKVHEFAMNSQSTILGQIRRFGASVDWSRLAFTLDDIRQQAVFTAFQKLFDLGLIYRKYRIVNWDVKGQTVISDDEIVYEERKSTLYTFRYSSEFPIPISTTRPETKIGDTAVAVHPKDIRYQQFIGKEFTVENFAGEKLTLKIIGDESVDPEFGTGALGVTPAHSVIDWEIAERHNLLSIPVIDEYGKMTAGMDGVKQQKTDQARMVIAEWIRQQGLMIEEKEILQNVATAERTGGIIEPLPKMQWWIDVEKKFPFPESHISSIPTGTMMTLKEIMLHVVKNKHIEIVPDRFKKTYDHWIHHLRPWNISRQIWFGHRVPVWYKNNDMKVSMDSPGEGWEQDPDTLDTWFSSGIWTLSTLGWPAQTDDFTRYHPTAVLETGYDIIFFWVARMILMSTALAGDIPFQTVYLQGLVRDEKGQKISKSLGNNIDPLDIIEEFGCDAMRMGLIIGTAPGQDSKVSQDKIRAYKKFANKLWNIARFVTDHYTFSEETVILHDDDQHLLENFKTLHQTLNQEMDEFKYYLVAEKLYHYIWHTFADDIIESSKPLFEDAERKKSRTYTLMLLLSQSLRALHPFMPFVTEKIWQFIPSEFKKFNDLLMIEPYEFKNIQ